MSSAARPPRPSCSCRGTFGSEHLKICELPTQPHPMHKIKYYNAQGSQNPFLFLPTYSLFQKPLIYVFFF